MLKRTGQIRELRCIGLGKYQIESEVCSPVKVILRNEVLRKAWSAAFKSPSEQDYLLLGYSHLANARVEQRISILEKRHDRHYRISESLALLWPKGVNQDFRMVNEVGADRSTFLCAFTTTLETILASADHFEKTEWVHRRDRRLP